MLNVCNYSGIGHCRSGQVEIWEEKTEHGYGHTGWEVVMPIVVLTGVLHLLVIIMILVINSVSTELSTIMQNAGKANQDATSLLMGSESAFRDVVKTLF